MKKTLLLVFIMLLGCRTQIVEIPSPTVCQTAYAIKDSFEVARVDLADRYTTELLKLVIPPKERILIEPIIKDGKRIAIIPEKYKDNNVVVVGSKEWEELKKVKTIADQLVNENKTLLQVIDTLENELRDQKQITNEIVAKNNELTIENNKLTAKVWRKNAYLIGLLLAICGYIYARINKLISF
jgi:hypothetical protein